mgnify:CR=1 FL=1
MVGKHFLHRDRLVLGPLCDPVHVFVPDDTGFVLRVSLVHGGGRRPVLFFTALHGGAIGGLFHPGRVDHVLLFSIPMFVVSVPRVGRTVQTRLLERNLSKFGTGPTKQPHVCFVTCSFHFVLDLLRHQFDLYFVSGDGPMVLDTVPVVEVQNKRR